MEKEREMEREQFRKEPEIERKRESDAFARLMVTNLLECGVSVEQVSKKTQIPMEKVRQIAKDLDLQEDNQQ